MQCSRLHTNSVWLCRIQHGGGSRDEREQLGVPPLVSGQIPPGIDHLKTDQSIWQGLEADKDRRRREERLSQPRTYARWWEWHIRQIIVTVYCKLSGPLVDHRVCIAVLHQSVQTKSSFTNKLSPHYFILSLSKSIFELPVSEQEIVLLWLTDLKVALQVLWQQCPDRDKIKSAVYTVNHTANPYKFTSVFAEEKAFEKRTRTKNINIVLPPFHVEQTPPSSSSKGSRNPRSSGPTWGTPGHYDTHSIAVTVRTMVNTWTLNTPTVQRTSWLGLYVCSDEQNLKAHLLFFVNIFVKILCFCVCVCVCFSHLAPCVISWA